MYLPDLSIPVEPISYIFKGPDGERNKWDTINL